MASHTLLLMSVVTVIVFNVSPGSMSSNFPLQNCTAGDIDIVELFLSVTYSEKLNFNYLCNVFGCNNPTISQGTSKSRDQNSTHEIAEPRIQYVKVFDTIDYHNHDVNISSWRFQSLQEEPDLHEIDYNPSLALQIKTVQEVTDQKIKFVQRLFSEMPGVRENAAHIAILFFSDIYFPYEKVRNIANTVQGHKTNIKIFVLMMSDLYIQKIVHLNDLLLMPFASVNYLTHIMTMAICKQCSPGWFQFEHNNSMHLLTCYRLIDTELIELNKEICTIDNGGHLAAIETKDELQFLKIRLYSEILKNPSYRHAFLTLYSYIGIGLIRDSKSRARRFQWNEGFTFPRHPLVINHWLIDKPSGVDGFNFGMWQFKEILNEDNNDSDVFQDFSHSKELFNDGWVDITTDQLLPDISLCEIVLPRKLDEQYTVKMEPANMASFSTTLTKGDFIKYDDIIVSASAHVASLHFLQFLKETKNDFPVFDCGEDAGQPRYISYTFVCDYVDHCTNRRDETSCLKPEEGCLRYCHSGEVISYNFNYCDDINDCEDGSDEKNCNGRCTGKYCSDGSCLQLQWLNDGEIDCILYEDVNDESVIHNNYLGENETCAFICNGGETCVHVYQLKDGSIDCSGPEGPLDETIGKLEPANTCYNLLGDVIWAPKCVYIKDRYGAVLGCRDMSHLQNCLDYKCVEGYVKCYKSYCIPLHYVLDGQADCPTGEEEDDFNTGSCSGNFACWNSNVCLHPDLVCNGYPDCPHKDDELNCDVSCPEGFRCVSGTITVSHFNISVHLENFDQIDTRTKYMDMSGVDLSRMYIFDHQNHVLCEVLLINWSRCNIAVIPSILPSKHMIQTLDISYNLIHNFIATKAMINALANIRYLNLSSNNNLVSLKNLVFSFLEIIDLSHTGLLYLDGSLFEELPRLRHLNLSYTFISNFNKNMFPSHFTLQTLDLRGIPIDNFYKDLLYGLTIDQHLYTDKFEMCCPQIRGTQIPYHTCHAPEDVISSCYNLIDVDVQRVLLWVVAFLAVLGNVAVIVYRTIWDRSVLNIVYSFCYLFRCTFTYNCIFKW